MMSAKDPQQLASLCYAIESGGFKTGSRSFGVETESSDYDYVMTIEGAYNIFRLLDIPTFKTDETKLEEYAGSFISLKYEKRQGYWINLIIVPTDFDLYAWKYATGSLEALNKRRIANKQDRTKLFGWALTDYYSTIPRSRTFKMALHLWGSGCIVTGEEWTKKKGGK